MSKRMQTEFDGKKCQIISEDHPHSGVTGVCMGAEVAGVLASPGLVIKSDRDGTEFFVFDPEDLKWLSKY